MKYLWLALCFGAASPLSADETTRSKKVYDCRYVESPPFGVSAWAQSEWVRTGTGKESRFVPYNSEAARGLILDATAMRKIQQNPKLVGRGTSFWMCYDLKGWYIYIQCAEPELQALEDKGKDISLELFFSPGLHNVPYYQMIIRQLGRSVRYFDWASPHRHYRSLKGRIRVESLPVEPGIGTFLFVPWEALYDRLPLNGDAWRFSFMRWNPGVTWGGNVHDTGNFGLVRFQKPEAAVVDAIHDRLVRRAWSRFRRRAAEEERKWRDEVLGDPAFFAKEIRPILDAYSPFEGDGEWDEATRRKARRHLGDWMEFDRTVAERRERFLRTGLTTPSPAESPKSALLTVYEVPALSPIKRLPGELPSDAREGAHLRLVAAQGEYEPASFLIAPKADVSKLVLKASALSGPGGSIPADHVDLKVVKCWYQGGTAWYSYFADNNRREFVPELLLNDETLVKVDRKKKENYLRIGDEYRWISYPGSKAKEYFDYFREPVGDAPTLQPVRLKTGENKQIWVTVQVPEKTSGGRYRGTVELIADGANAGAVTLDVRVLPFTLPRPRTYYDLEKEYLVTLYGAGMLGMAKRMGVDPKDAEAQQLAIYRNLLAHNVFNCRSDIRYSSNRRTGENNGADLVRELRLMKKAGFSMKPVISSTFLWHSPSAGDRTPEDLKQRMKEAIDLIEREVGHRDIYITSWDEAGRDRTLTMRKLAGIVNELGAKLWVTTAHGRHFNLAGYAIGYANHGGWPSREEAATWHAIGAKVASYAGPHTGPESPDVFRRWEGLARYKAHYDGSFNYKYYSAHHTTLYARHKSNVWNDFSSRSFRKFNLVYPTRNGVIDTIAWEGYREGIDDVRYATRLKLDAARAIDSGKPDAAYTARKALMWLELVNERSEDLNAVRMELIAHLLRVRASLED